MAKDKFKKSLELKKQWRKNYILSGNIMVIHLIDR